jgi:hypothetical protein
MTKPLPNNQVEKLHRAFIQYQVIFFREQEISFDDHIRLGRYFGSIGKHVGGATISKTTDNPYVRKFHYDKTSTQISGENFHSDQSCGEISPLGSILYNHTVPPDGGGDTMFASMYAAYDALSPRMQSYLSGLTATHDGRRVFGPTAPVAVHPVIIKHPVTGKKVIYVNTDFTAKINELHRGRTGAAIPDRSLQQVGMDLPLPLARAFDRVLGQSLHPSQGGLGLLAECAIRLSHPDRGHRRAGSGLIGEEDSATAPLGRPAAAAAPRQRWAAMSALGH